MSRRTAASLLTLATLVFVTALLLGACGGGGGHSMSPTTARAPQTVVVDVQDNYFSPQSVSIQPGDTVQWVLRGSNTHHTTRETNGLWDSGMVFTAPGATFSHTFGNADTGHTYNYYCITHQACCQMQGSIRVGDSAPPPGPGY